MIEEPLIYNKYVALHWRTPKVGAKQNQYEINYKGYKRSLYRLDRDIGFPVFIPWEGEIIEIRAVSLSEDGRITKVAVLDPPKTVCLGDKPVIWYHKVKELFE